MELPCRPACRYATQAWAIMTRIRLMPCVSCACADTHTAASVSALPFLTQEMLNMGLAQLGAQLLQNVSSTLLRADADDPCPADCRAQHTHRGNRDWHSWGHSCRRTSCSGARLSACSTRRPLAAWCSAMASQALASACSQKPLEATCAVCSRSESGQECGRLAQALADRPGDPTGCQVQTCSITSHSPEPAATSHSQPPGLFGSDLGHSGVWRASTGPG